MTEEGLLWILAVALPLFGLAIAFGPDALEQLVQRLARLWARRD